MTARTRVSTLALAVSIALGHASVAHAANQPTKADSYGLRAIIGGDVSADAIIGGDRQKSKRAIIGGDNRSDAIIGGDVQANAIIGGDVIVGAGFYEPQGRYNLADVSLKATREGNG